MKHRHQNETNECRTMINEFDHFQTGRRPSTDKQNSNRKQFPYLQAHLQWSERRPTAFTSCSSGSDSSGGDSSGGDTAATAAASISDSGHYYGRQRYAVRR